MSNKHHYSNDARPMPAMQPPLSEITNGNASSYRVEYFQNLPTDTTTPDRLEKLLNERLTEGLEFYCYIPTISFEIMLIFRKTKQ